MPQFESALSSIGTMPQLQSALSTVGTMPQLQSALSKIATMPQFESALSSIATMPQFESALSKIATMPQFDFTGEESGVELLDEDRAANAAGTINDAESGALAVVLIVLAVVVQRHSHVDVTARLLDLWEATRMVVEGLGDFASGSFMQGCLFLYALGEIAARLDRRSRDKD